MVIKSQFVMYEKQILCDSHLDEKRFEEKDTVTKIQEDTTRSLVSVKLLLVLL